MAIGLLLAALPFLIIGLSLGFLGGGGSILTVPVLVYGLHMEPKTAIATSLIVVGLTSLLGALRHHWAGKLKWRTGLVFGVAGMVGAYAGGRIAAFLSPVVLLTILAVMMLVTAAAMLRGRRRVADCTTAPGAAVTPLAPGQSHSAKTLATGFGVGSLTGLVGAGGGFMIVPALVLLEGMEMGAAIATSLLVIALNSFAGLLGYIQHVHVALPLVVTISLFSMAGCLVGCLLANRVRPEALRKGFGVFILLVAVYLIYKQAGSIGLV